MKEVRNDIIDNVYLYRMTIDRDRDGDEKSVTTTMDELKGEIHTGIGIRHNQAKFKGYNGKTNLFVDPKPGEIRQGCLVWFNEKNPRGAFLAFMEYKLKKMEAANDAYKNALRDYHALKNMLSLEDEHA